MEPDGPNREVGREAELRRAIVAEPDRDDLRLVYADHWEEAGDPERAELIRIDLELARDPDAPGAVRRRIERDVLVARNLERWDAPVGLAFGYRRGMIASLTGTPDDVAALVPAARAEHPIERVEINTWGPQHGEIDGVAPAVAGLRELRIEGNEHLAPIAYPELLSPQLERLEVVADFAELVPLLAIHAPPELRALELHHRGDTPATPAVAALSQLREVVLRGNLDGRLTPGPQLRRLSLMETEAELSTLAELSHLESLELDDVRFDAGGLAALVDAGIIDRLARLALDDLEVDVGPVLAAGGRVLRHLRLNAVDVRAGDLATAGDFPALRSLDLSDNPLSPEAFGALAPMLESLSSLMLAGTGLTASDAATLARAGAPRLERLILDGNRLGDDGLDALIDAGFLDSVVDLSLSYTNVTELGVVRLLELPALAQLCIHETAVSRELAARLDSHLVRLYY